MTLVQWLVGLALALAPLAACSSGGDGGGGGASGAAGGGGSAACATATSSCEVCVTCRFGGACKPQVDACEASSDCTAFTQCVQEQDDPAVIAQCRTDHPTGASEFCAQWDCALSECTICEPSQVCP